MYPFDTSPTPIETDTGAQRVSRKSGVLELAVLGLLNESPMHGYELRKQLSQVLGYIEKLNAIDVTGIEPLAFAGDQDPAGVLLRAR